MYEYEGLQDVIFIALYCVAAFAALLTCVYLSFYPLCLSAPSATGSLAAEMRRRVQR